MPNELYLVRLIHHQTGRPFPGERLWTADPVGGCGYHPLSARSQLRGVRRLHSALRRKPKRRLYSRRSGSCAIRRSWRSCAPTDMTLVWCCRPAPAICRPGFASAPAPLEPAVATAAGKHLARLYGGDWASTDWRHLGRLAGFTNQKPARRTPGPLRPVGETRPRPCGFGAARRVVVAVRQAICTTAGLAVPDRLDRHRSWPNQRRGGHHDLPELYAAMAYSRTLSAAGLEHRRSLGRQAPALAGQARCSDSSHPPARQSAFSPPPRRSR